jgi:hypothetical protein
MAVDNKTSTGSQPFAASNAAGFTCQHPLQTHDRCQILDKTGVIPG